MSQSPFGYGSLISESLRFSWRLKILWILGLLADSGASFSLATRGRGHLLPRTSLEDALDLGLALPLMLFLLGLGGLIFIVLLVLRVIGQGGLIQAGNAEATGARPALGEAWRAGVDKILPVFVTMLLGAVVLIGAGITGIGFPVLIGSLVHPAAGLLIGFFTCSVLAVFLLLFVPLVAYAMRAIVIENADVLSAWQTALDMLRWQPGRVVLVSLLRVCYMIGIAVACFAVWVLLFPPLAALWLIWPPLAVVIGLFIALPVGVVLGGFFGSAGSYYWTLAFLWTRRGMAGPAASGGGADGS